MCKADYYGSSIVDEKHFALYIKDKIDSKKEDGEKTVGKMHENGEGQSGNISGFFR